jgi:hypothetical protein
VYNGSSVERGNLIYKEASMSEEDGKRDKTDAMSPKGKYGILAAIYGYQDYPANFSSYYFSAGQIVQSVQNIIKSNFTKNGLQWGYYQKYAADDPSDITNWTRHDKKGADLYKNWEAAVAEARENLAKLPVDSGQVGPDPDHPNDRADNLIDHLDAAVAIALFDKHQPGNSDQPGIPIEVKVGFQSYRWRHHKVTTQWEPNPNNVLDPKFKWLKLTITMTCPNGGWVGTAVWDTGPSKFTSYTATYMVPAPPKDYEQILFVFNGLESMPDPGQALPPGILQPVLQWTHSDGWAVRSWYVPASYDPLFTDMPALNDERKFTDAKSPAWTAATQLDKMKKVEVQGVIYWDGSQYVSKFVIGGQDVAVLRAPGIKPLTYPVAVIEAYSKAGPKSPVPKDGLVNIDMTKISLSREDVLGPVQPSWDVGTDDPTNPGIHYGTNRLQRYEVKPTYGSNDSQLKFTVR